MEMHPKIRAGDAFRISAASVVTASSGRPASTTDATRATLLFHNSLRHVSMAPSWVSRPPSLSLSLSLLLALVLSPRASPRGTRTRPLRSPLLRNPRVLRRSRLSRTPKVSHYLWHRVREYENGKRGREIVPEGGKEPARRQVRPDGLPLSRIIDPKSYRGPDTSSSVHREGSASRGLLQLHLEYCLKLRFELIRRKRRFLSWVMAVSHIS